MSILAGILQRAYSKISYVTLFFIVLYTIAAIVVSVNRFWQYQNFYFDLGIFDSAIWQVSRFGLPYVDHVDFGNQKILIFGDHFNPSIFLLSPLYWFTNRTEVLLIAQSLAVGLGGLFAYLIGRKVLKNQLAVLALVVAFLGYVGLQNALISDFHEATVAVLPLTAIFWAIINKRWKLYFLLLIIFLGFKEVFAGLGVGLGLYLMIRDRKNYQIGLATVLISLAWGFVAIKFIIPYFSNGIYLYTPKELPSSMVEIFNKFIPELRWKTIVYTYLTFGLLPIFNMAVFPMIWENFFERFVLSASKGNDLGMHYNAVLSPILFMGSLYTFKFMQEHRILSKIVLPYSLIIIFIVLFLHRFVLSGPLGLFYNPVFYEQNQRVRYVDNFVAHFPTQGRIMTQNDLAVRLAHYDIVLLRRDYESVNPDYVILNLTPGQNPNGFFPLSIEEVQSLKDSLRQNKNYTMTKYADELYMFTKKEIIR